MTSEELALELEERGRIPAQAEIEWLESRGIEPVALVRTWRRRFDFSFIASVVFRHDCFEFEPGARDEAPIKAILFAARDEAGLIDDIIAWQPELDYLAPWLGRACLLGAENIGAFRAQEGLPVHRSPLGWLRAHRQGIVIIEPLGARLRLRDHGPFAAEDYKHGVELERLLACRPTVVIPTPRSAAAAP